MRLYTIGHCNRSLDRLLALLAAPGVRQLLADAALLRGAGVWHILGDRVIAHELTPFAETSGTRITYPFSLQAGAGEER